MASNLVDGVRDACASVVPRAAFVRLDEQRLAAVARALPLERLDELRHDPLRHHLGRGEETAAFFVTLDTLNFGSGWFPVLRKLPGCSGYFTIASHLTRRFRERGAFPLDELLCFDAVAASRLFAQDPADPDVGQLMTLFARALQDLGRLLGERYGGSYPALIESAGRSAARLVAQLVEMPLFRDVSRHGHRPIPFYKRAQILAADLALAFDEQGLGAFDDLERLTLFADNLVPHVLRLEGVLRYDDELAGAIDAGFPLAAGSPEEVEIRAVAVTAVERMVALLVGEGRRVSARQLDFLLWTRGQEPRCKARPRHRTRCPFY